MLLITTDDVVRLVGAFLVGLALGVEREYHDKSAGMRAITLICVGATLFVLFSQRIAAEGGRVAAQIVTGVGFLGAGVILQRRGQIVGLTTASTIWVAAALGVGMGVGAVFFTSISAMLVIFVLSALPYFERVFQRANAFKSYKITLTYDPGKPARLKKVFTDIGLRVREDTEMKGKDSIVLVWYVSGKPSLHRLVSEAMIQDPEVKEFEY